MDSDLSIPDDVLEAATSDIPLTLPGGQKFGKAIEPVILMGSAVKQVDSGGKAKVIVELSFRTADTASPTNIGRSFQKDFWMNAASLKSRDELARDKGTALQLRVLKELFAALGVPHDGQFLAKLQNITPELLSGKAINMQWAVKDASGPKFNVNGFAPLA